MRVQSCVPGVLESRAADSRGPSPAPAAAEVTSNQLVTAAHQLQPSASCSCGDVDTLQRMFQANIPVFSSKHVSSRAVNESHNRLVVWLAKILKAVCQLLFLWTSQFYFYFLCLNTCLS